MDIVRKLLRDMPLFRHCSDDEISRLQKMARLSTVKKGQHFDLKKTTSLNVVIYGLFEIETFSGSDVVHCTPGSFFGSIPLTGNRQRGIIKAMMDSSLLIISEEDIYRFFLLSFKGLRGYQRAIKRAGFDISAAGERFSGESSRIVTVYSPYTGSGKSFFSALMGTALSGNGEKTIILDLSYQGQSVYNLFGMKITSPISQKQDDSSSFEQMLPERIVKIDDNLHLFNIASGSKVKVAPEIISPILFFLSKEYRYIICDCSDVDPDLRDSVFDSTDIIFSLSEGGKKQEKAFRVFDRALSDGQRVYYVHNEYTMGSVKNVTGSMLLEEVPVDKNETVYPQLREFCGKKGFQIFGDIVTAEKRALVLESNMLESVFLFGILKSLDESGKKYDVIYTSSFSFIVAALYMTSSGMEEFRKNMHSFFAVEKLNSFLDITFPDRFIFKNSSISRIASDIAGKSRLEMYRTVPMPLLAEGGSGSKRIFSTGYLRDCMEASFSLYPLFESGTVSGSEYYSGYPLYRVRSEDLFRTDVDSISFVSVNNHDRLRINSDRMLPFYRKYIEFIEEERYDEKKSNAADYSFSMELNESSFKLDRLLEQSEKMAAEIIRNIPW